MQLYLMQHGDAVPKTQDPDRPLSDAGRQSVKRTGAFLKRAPFRPARVLHSGKTRARQSAETLAGLAAPGAAVRAMEGLAPKDDVEPMARQAGGWSDDTLLVGHLPFMGRLVAHLLRGGNGVSFQPGSVVCLERDDEGVWRIAWMLRPELLDG